MGLYLDLALGFFLLRLLGVLIWLLFKYEVISDTPTPFEAISNIFLTIGAYSGSGIK